MLVHILSDSPTSTLKLTFRHYRYWKHTSMMNPVIPSTTLPLLTAANWYQWEKLALNSISVYRHAGRAIQTNVFYVPKPPSKSLRIHNIEEVILDPNTNIVTEQESSRPWNDATDWPLYNKATEAYMFLQERYLRNNLYGHI